MIDISEHPLLSPEAHALARDHGAVFEAVVDSAKINITAVVGVLWDQVAGDDTIAQLALVYQVNYQLEIPSDAGINKRVKGGDSESERVDDLALVPSRVVQLAQRLPVPAPVVATAPKPAGSTCVPIRLW